MLNQQINFKRIRMIEILAISLFQAQMAQIAIVMVEMEMRAFQFARQFLRKRSLPRP